MEVILETPRVPNFLRIAGVGEGAAVSIGDVPDEDLEIIGDEWTRKLLDRAAVIRADNLKAKGNAA